MMNSPSAQGSQTLILGLGTGRCGTHSLTDILNRQPDASFTHEEYPLLPWERRPGEPGIVERLRRIRRTRPRRFVGDVATFYLPYAEEAIAHEPDIRMICLERPREEVVASLERWLDTVHPLPTDHCSRNLAPGWHREPFWSRILPRYDVHDRASGFRMYWDEYHRTAAELARRFPRQFRVFPVEALNSESGLRDMLMFAGIPTTEQVVGAGTRESRGQEARAHWRREASMTPDRRDPRHCAVLVPYHGAIAPECEEGLRALERRGYEVRRAGGADSLDLLRSRMATFAVLDGFREVMWIGADIAFAPEDVDRLRAHDVPIAGALYAHADRRTLSCRPLAGNGAFLFGEAGGLHEIEHAGAGFLLVRRAVFVAVQEHHRLPFCDEATGQPVIPFFRPVVGPHEDGWRWLESDFGFCELARQAGFRVVADTTIRLWRQGRAVRSWEDVGAGPQRYATYHLTVN